MRCLVIASATRTAAPPLPMVTLGCRQARSSDLRTLFITSLWRSSSRSCTLLIKMSKGDILDGLLPSSSVELATEADPCSAMCAEVYDLIRTIRDPEKPQNLEELDVVRESDVRVEYLGSADWPLISIQFTPTVPHCSLATLIGLCIRVKLERNFASVYRYKLDICIKKGRHSTEDDINKQINDKERIAAALENPSLLELVESCIEVVDS